MHLDNITTERFWQNVVPGENEEDKCWGWLGPIGKGAARISIGGEWYLASRIAWILTYGELPEGARIRRTCGSLLCANPKHSELMHSSTEEMRFWERVNIIDDDDSCWEWTGAKTHKGYGKVYHDGSVIQTHRLAYELEYGPIPDNLFVLHKCDNPACCRVSHLFLGTLQDNHADMVTKKRHTWGENHPGAQLNWEQVREIRKRLENGETGRSIAKEYGLSAPTISNIRTKTTWRE